MHHIMNDAFHSFFNPTFVSSVGVLAMPVAASLLKPMDMVGPSGAKPYYNVCHWTFYYACKVNGVAS